jgi:peptide/nickel transport system substrate-binding protein
LLSGEAANEAITDFAASKNDMVLGGTFVDLPMARQIRLPGGSLHFDPASGLFGLVPAHAGGPLDKPEVRQLLARALDRANFIAALGVPGLAARATLLEPGLDGMAVPIQPAWFGAPPGDRLQSLQADATRLFGKARPKVAVALPLGSGADMLIQELRRDWGAIGLTVDRAPDPSNADFLLVDEVAPSSSPAWFVRHFRCGAAPVCDAQADQLMEAARTMPVAAQRYALLSEAAARIDDAELFIPITAPVRWSLVSGRVQSFAGNRYARHTLTDLEEKGGGSD